MLCVWLSLVGLSVPAFLFGRTYRENKRIMNFVCHQKGSFVAAKARKLHGPSPRPHSTP